VPWLSPQQEEKEEEEEEEMEVSVEDATGHLRRGGHPESH
jgi:hypothetical protein